MGNRKLPFGYKMSLGEVTIHSDEAMLVREIFERYLSGESLKGLVEAMEEQPIPYGEERAWNKNMIARILEDQRYTGEKGFPKLIEPKELLAVAEKRSQKVKPSQKTEAQKIIRRLCGKSPPEWVEQAVMGLLNRLIRHPNLVQQSQAQRYREAPAIRSELDIVMEQQPIDEEHAKSLILKIAAEQYEVFGNEEYETIHLRRLFVQAECGTEPDAALLKSSVSKITFTDQEVKLQLKNGQVIERSDLQ